MNPPSLPEVSDLLQNLENELRPHCTAETLMIGVHTGGVWLAGRLHDALGITTALGTLDIAFYRDDFSRVGLHPQVKGSHLPESVEDQDVILIDDVLQSGRTIRAALNEIFSYGRPSSVRLAVLVERSGRELPIQADFIGAHLQLESGEYVKLLGPNPLSLVLTGGPRRSDMVE